MVRFAQPSTEPPLTVPEVSAMLCLFHAGAVTSRLAVTKAHTALRAESPVVADALKELIARGLVGRIQRRLDPMLTGAARPGAASALHWYLTPRGLAKADELRTVGAALRHEANAVRRSAA